MANIAKLLQDVAELQRQRTEDARRIEKLEKRVERLRQRQTRIEHQLPEGAAWTLGSVLHIPSPPAMLEVSS